MPFQLIERIERHAASNPVAPAFIGRGGSMTYAEVVDSIARVGIYFDDLGLPRGGKAFLNIGNPDLRLVVMMAAMDYGLTPMIAQPDTLRTDCNWSVAIGSAEPTWRDVPSDVLIDQSVFAGQKFSGGRRKFPDRDDSEIAFIAETSGSTGRPKLVGITWMQMRSTVDDAWRRRSAPGARIMSTLGTGAKYAIRQATMALADGAAVVTSSRDVNFTLSLINVFNVTFLLTTPVYLDLAMDLMDAKKVRCPSIKEIQLTGSTFSSHLLRRVESHFDCEIRVAYGASEVEVGIARGLVSADTYAPGYVGEVNPELKLIATGTKAKPGSIVIVHDKDRFTRAFVKERVVRWDQPFYVLPDVGYVDGSILYLAGRSDEVYNFSGNIKAYSVIAEELGRLVPVKDAAVVNGSALGHELDLVIGVVSDKVIHLDDLATRLTIRLEMPSAKNHFKLVQVPVIVRDQQSGKIDRAALVSEYQRQHPNVADPVDKARGSVEENSPARG